jgi:hypothetical protein
MITQKSSLITTVEVNENFTVVYSNNIPLAVISYNETDTGNYITHPWVVMVEGNEIHNCSTWQQAYSHIVWHHKQSTLSPVPAAKEPVAA